MKGLIKSVWRLDTVLICLVIFGGLIPAHPITAAAVVIGSYSILGLRQFNTYQRETNNNTTDRRISELSEQIAELTTTVHLR